MSDRLIKSETLSDIANAIRERTETTEKINPRDFASHIRTLEVIEEYDEAVTVDSGATVVFDEDYTEGYEEGFEAGKSEGGGGSYEEGYEAGKKSQYDEFWDAYQNNGKSSNYNGAFAGVRWTLNVFKPKYAIKGFYSAMNIFWSNNMALDLPELLESLGIELDFSQAFNVSNAFSYSKFTRLGVLDFSKATTAAGPFGAMSNLETIDKIIVSEDTALAVGWFNGCAALKNITFEGPIAKTGLSFQWSTKLSKASITSIINALSTTTSGLSVTLSKMAVETAFSGTTSAEWTSLIATRSNWTISLV